LRNSGIFTIEDNQQVISDIYDKTLTQTLGNDVNPTDGDGNPYTFYGYIRKALEYSITEFDNQGNEKTLNLLTPDEEGNINPDSFISKEQFLKMAYIALKSNNCQEINENALALRLDIWDKSCDPNKEDCTYSNLNDPQNIYDFEPYVQTTCESGIS